MLRRRNRPEESAEIMKTAVEVASVKAQAQSIIRRVKLALDELEETVNTLPEESEEVHVDAGPPADA